MQGLVERILAEDGITKEVIEAQQKVIELIQRLASISDEEALAQVVSEEDEKINAELFGLMNQLIEGSSARGDNEFAKKLVKSTILKIHSRDCAVSALSVYAYNRHTALC